MPIAVRRAILAWALLPLPMIARAQSPALLRPDSAALAAHSPAVYRAEVTTGRGRFVIEVHRVWAPRGADRFHYLVKNGFYDGAAFFRVLPGFIAQFGVNADPAVTAVWKTRRFPDDPATHSNLRGTVTFASAGPGTRTSQLFINTGDNKQLDGLGFAPLGRVISGMGVVDSLYGGYGEGAPDGTGPDQGRLAKEGGAYLSREFPELDVIRSARLVPVPTTGKATTGAPTMHAGREPDEATMTAVRRF